MKTIKLIASLSLLLPTLTNALTTITVHNNNEMQSTYSKICPTVEGCIGQALELDRNGGNDGRYTSIIVMNHAKVIMMRNYSTTRGFDNVEEFYK